MNTSMQKSVHQFLNIHKLGLITTFALFALLLAFTSCKPEKPKKIQFSPLKEAVASPKSAPNPSPEQLNKLPDPTRSGWREDIARFPPQQVKQTETTLRIVSYNLWNYLNRAREGEEVQFKSEKQIASLVAMIVSLRPDILGVSEIGTEADLHDLQTRLAEAGLVLPYFAWTKGEDGVRNLGLLSYFPITKASNPMLSYSLTHKNGKRVSTLMERGILDVSLQVNEDYFLRTLGVHLKSKREVDYANQELIRSSEAQLLRNHAEEILRNQPQTNLLIYGDMNDTSRSRTLDILRGMQERNHPLRLIDIPLEDANGDRWTQHWAWQDVYSRFDYFLYNTALKPEIVFKQSGIALRAEKEKASDHRALFLVLDVSQEEE